MTTREIELKVRNMYPYENILFSIAKFFQPGEDLTILEIGVCRGSSTRILLKGINERIQEGLGSGHLWSIDKDDRENVVKNLELKKIWTFMLGYSSLMPEKPNYPVSRVEWDKKIDILFIDGDHSYNGVKADYQRYEPFVKDGGLILMHDITYWRFGVKKLWKEIKLPKIILSFNHPGMGLIQKI